MCGNPAVPNINAIPSEMVSSGFETSLPGLSTASPYLLAAAAKRAAGLKWKRASTSSARSNAQEGCRAHVVAGERESVLPRTDGAPRGVEVFGRVRASRRPVCDAQRDENEENKKADGHRIRLPDRGRVHRTPPASRVAALSA